jgi:hypothetical protein
MNSQQLTGLSLLFCLIFSLSACSKVERLPTLEAAEVATLGNDCQALYQGFFNTWNSRNPENMPQIFTDDIVPFDGEPAFVGIDSVVEMATVMFEVFPDWQMTAGQTYVSKDECLGTWLNWGLLGLEEDDPGIEYDLLQTRDGKIYFWQMFYNQRFHEVLDEPPVNLDFLAQFTSAWSARNTDELMKIYAQDAEIEDTLFEMTATGEQAIQDYADRFFAQSSEISWELLTPFSESPPTPAHQNQYPIQSQGGVFAIHVQDANGNPCEIQAVAILTPNDEGNIQTQKIFYQADSLVVCGWAK